MDPQSARWRIRWRKLGRVAARFSSSQTPVIPGFLYALPIGPVAAVLIAFPGTESE